MGEVLRAAHQKGLHVDVVIDLGKPGKGAVWIALFAKHAGHANLIGRFATEINLPNVSNAAGWIGKRGGNGGVRHGQDRGAESIVYGNVREFPILGLATPALPVGNIRAGAVGKAGCVGECQRVSHPGPCDSRPPGWKHTSGRRREGWRRGGMSESFPSWALRLPPSRLETYERAPSGRLASRRNVREFPILGLAT